ncbi:MAG: hypothetical protein P4M15_05985 [Alphaproteobacteria bacterium]|nr:hypothetical protein [Alphaproteobacteria bacterium]
MTAALDTLRQNALRTPEDIDKWLDLCGAAENARDYATVLLAGDQIVRLAPNGAAAHYIRGLALHYLDRSDESIAAYRRVVDCDPAYLDAWINLGHEYQAMNRLAEAEHAYRRAIAVSGQEARDETAADADYGSMYWNLAVVELLRGDLAGGFRHYPARFKATVRRRPDFPQPLWRGEDLHGKTILITVDQGHGDTLMMARYVPLLRVRGGRVLFQVQPALFSLFTGWGGADVVLRADEAVTLPFDYHADIFDLPCRFSTTLDTVPAAPYLPLPQESIRLPETGKPKIGLTWCGFSGHANDARRSMPLAALAALCEIRGADFYALVRDKRPGDDGLLAQLPVADLGQSLGDFSDSARFIGQLDLVITCDTAIAHLAGGMGKPVWVLLPFAPSWCWLMEREDSPWYPTARLFRQQKPGDWQGVVTNVAKALSDRFGL